MRILRSILLSLTLTLCLSNIYAQNLEIGVWGGVANYFGDINTKTSFQFVGPGGGLFVRNILSNRFALKHGVAFGIVSFDESKTTDPHRIQRNLHFKSNVFELGSQLEFNFFAYEQSSQTKFFTPYIFAGLSVFYFNPKALYEGEWYELQPLGTEGQNDPNYTGREKYRLISFAIPIGGGLKYSFSYNFAIGLIFGTRKTFTDYLDDVSTTYVSPLSLPGGEGSVAYELSDPSVDKIGEAGYQRGNPNKNDDYFFGGISISYTFMQDKCPKPKGL
ncbi:MAG: hypothetical protein HKN92_12575 [Chitinophagales bacterium]|nr:hypothetical protein [Chitinophagales bacterium]